LLFVPGDLQVGAVWAVVWTNNDEPIRVIIKPQPNSSAHLVGAALKLDDLITSAPP
jgi:hypothetical protein